MHEFHGWLTLRDDPHDRNDAKIEEVIADLRLKDLGGGHTTYDLVQHSGSYFLTVTGLVNRRRGEWSDLMDLVSAVAERLPGSYGLIYELDDELPEYSFRVRVIARGQVLERRDPFLSPAIPTIEDEEDPTRP